VHAFPNRPDSDVARLVLDLRDRVSDYTKANEEGLLGLALHPDFARNGELFVCYTSADEPRRTRISRFRGAGKNPFHRIEPSNEEILLEIRQPFANHNGGSIAFGPDGFLYIGLGDGGSQYDPLQNGQNRSTLLGSILRIDIDHTAGEMPYAIPADNPFVNQPGARPEIYALGFRNVWQLSFDAKTGDLWAADVGQDQWEEIDVVRRGGNYGWNLREGMQRFGNAPTTEKTTFIDPVWQYDHRLGRSITGGVVYRGAKIPELAGHYLYADYVSGRIWALEYDRDSGRVLTNNAIALSGLPVLAFGQDDQGEAYYMTEGAEGRAIYRLEPVE
jgi:glucose/arabinose dehydrogenase